VNTQVVQHHLDYSIGDIIVDAVATSTVLNIALATSNWIKIVGFIMTVFFLGAATHVKPNTILG
jgi:hypothetical protein